MVLVMNNYCRNCGEKLENGIKSCPKCSAEVFDERINVDEKKKELEVYKKKEKKYIIIVITLFAIALAVPYLNFLGIYSFISYLSSLALLGAIITLIFARITMNNSKKIKIMFNIFLALTILYFLYILFIFAACYVTLNRGC